MIGYAGLSHLGLVSSIAAASKGFDVVAFDEDAALVERLHLGQLPVVEPGLSALLAEQRSRLTFTADVSALAGCEMVYVSVDVPTDDQHRSDVRPVEQLVQVVARATRPGAIIVVLSQVPPGFCRVQRPAAERAGQLLYYQVETLIFGRAVERALEPERFIVGCADPALPLPQPLEGFLGSFGCPILPMRYESAELCKIGINMFLVASVSTTNMLAELCEAIGAEWREIAPALRLDQRIGPHAYLTPGLGVGGGNLTRDLETVKSLANQHGTDAGIIDAWNANTRHRVDWAVVAVRKTLLTHVPNATLGIWGLTYKENTQVTKNSPSLHLIGQLRGVPMAAYDPAARLLPEETPSWLRVVGSPLEACRGADGLVVMTPWAEFSRIDPAAIAAVMRGRVLIDPFGSIDATAADRHGFSHYRLGTGRLA